MRALILACALFTGAAYASGNSNNNDGCQGNCPQGGGSATATAVSGAAASSKSISGAVSGASVGDVSAVGGGATASTGSASADVDTKAYGGGSTGLTSTARCLGSMSFGFNAFATTYTVEHCVLMFYAEMICKTDPACWKRVALVDENLTDEQRTALGIAKPASVPTAKNVAETPYGERTPVAFTQGQ